MCIFNEICHILDLPLTQAAIMANEGLAPDLLLKMNVSRYNHPGCDWNHGWPVNPSHINTLRVYPNPMRKSLSFEGYLYLYTCIAICGIGGNRYPT